MTSINLLEARIAEHVSTGAIFKDNQATVLVKHHMGKAKHNLLVSRLMFELSNNQKHKCTLKPAITSGKGEGLFSE